MAVLTHPSPAAAATDDFAELGFAVARGLFSSSEVTEWRKEADRLLHLEIINADNLRSPHKHAQAPYPQTIDPVLDISPQFRSLAADDRVERLVESLLHGDAALFKDELYFHLPATHNEPWRQDAAQGWEELAHADALTLLFSIDPADGNYGCIEIYQNSHGHLLTPRGETRSLSEAEVHALDAGNFHRLEAEPGDIVILHCLTPHRNGNNLMTYPRRSLNLTFNSLRDGEVRKDYYEHDLARREQAQPGKEFL